MIQCNVAVVKGNVSSFQKIDNGLPQCPTHGPLLFFRISLYADDTFVSNETKGKLDIRKELYPDFIKLSEWLKANKLPKFLKSEFMAIGNPRKCGELKGSLRTGDSLIRIVKQTKSVGVIIDKNLSLESHIEYISKKDPKEILGS